MHAASHIAFIVIILKSDDYDENIEAMGDTYPHLIHILIMYGFSNYAAKTPENANMFLFCDSTLSHSSFSSLTSQHQYIVSK